MEKICKYTFDCHRTALLEVLQPQCLNIYVVLWLFGLEEPSCFAGTALSADQPYGPSLKREDGLEEWKARKRKEKKRKAERGRQPSDVTFSYHHQGPIDPEFKEEATSPSDSIPQKKIKLKIKLQPSGGDQP